MYLITEMPTTGRVTNVTQVTDQEAAAWAGAEHVRVLTDEQYDHLPRCELCGEWVALGRCGDCRP